MQYEEFVSKLASSTGIKLDQYASACRLQNDEGVDVLIIERGNQDGEAYLMSEIASSPSDLVLRDAVNKTLLQINGVLEELPEVRVSFNPETDRYLAIRGTQGDVDPATVCEDLLAFADSVRRIIEDASAERATLDGTSFGAQTLSV